MADIPTDGKGNYAYYCSDITNYDGDSFRMTLRKKWDFGFHIHCEQSYDIHARIKGVDTPELRDYRPDFKAAGFLARDKAREFVQGAQNATFISMDKPDKYGRALGDIEIEGGKRLSEFLLENRLGVPYEGQNKADVEELHEENIKYLRGQGLI